MDQFFSPSLQSLIIILVRLKIYVFNPHIKILMLMIRTSYLLLRRDPLLIAFTNMSANSERVLPGKASSWVIKKAKIIYQLKFCQQGNAMQYSNNKIYLHHQKANNISSNLQKKEMESYIVKLKRIPIVL